MKKLLVLTILITFVGILPSLIQYGCFLLAADISSQEVPFIIETKRMLSTGVPFWSWNHVIGDNFIGSYSFYTLTSPFVWINCLFPYDWVVYSMTFTLFLKMICTSIFSYWYFRKMRISDDLCVVGALMYTFSSFAISNLFYYHFMEPMMVFPLFLIAIESFLHNEKQSEVKLALGSFLVMFINFYFAPCSMIAAFVYSLCRIRSSAINIGIGRIVYGLLIVVIGVLLSSFILLPTVYHMQGTPRQGMKLGYLVHQITYPIERLRTLFEPKLLEQPNAMLEGSSWYSNASNVPVVGLLLAALYVLRQRNWIGLLVITGVFLYVSPLNGIFSLFTNPNYSRWAYALTLFIILASIKFVDEGLTVKQRHFCIYLAIALSSIVLSYGFSYYINLKYGSKVVPSDYMTNAIIQFVFIVEMVLLYVCVRMDMRRMLLPCVVVMSMFYFSVRVLVNTDAYNKHDVRNGWVGIIDKKVLHNTLPRNDSPVTYRTDFVAGYRNMGLMRNVASVETFSSVQNTTTAKLYQAIGSKVGTNNIAIKSNAVSYDALMSVRDIIIYDDKSKDASSREECLGKNTQRDGYTVYENKYYIPFGFTYDSYVEESIIDSINALEPKQDVPRLLLANMAVPKGLVHIAQQYMREGYLADSLSIDSLVMERRRCACTVFEGDNRGFEATVNMARSNLLFFSVPADKGFTAYVDGKVADILPVNLGLSAVEVGQGKHHIRFSFIPKGLIEGAILSLLGMLLLFCVYIKVLSGLRRR